MEACCTCATLLSAAPRVSKDEKPLPSSRRLECCRRVICGSCIHKNSRFSCYCPYCQISSSSSCPSGPFPIPTPLPQGALVGPPPYQDHHASVTVTATASLHPSLTTPTCSPIVSTYSPLPPPPPPYTPLPATTTTTTTSSTTQATTAAGTSITTTAATSTVTPSIDNPIPLLPLSHSLATISPSDLHKAELSLRPHHGPAANDKAKAPIDIDVNIDVVAAATATAPTGDVLHFLDHERDTVSSLSLRYGVPAAALRQANNLGSDYLLAGRRIVRIPAAFNNSGVSLSPRPVQGETQEARKLKIRRWMVACKVADYDVAIFYLDQAGYHLGCAIDTYFADEAWERDHPLHTHSGGNGKSSPGGWLSHPKRQVYGLKGKTGDPSAAKSKD